MINSGFNILRLIEIVLFYCKFQYKSNYANKRFPLNQDEKPICENILQTTLLQNNVKFIIALNFTDRIPNRDSKRF